MAKPSTTHVIEIETGIGEPAFIPLTMGQELQPISVGKKGMWRIESARVLDVHAFVYFDGTSLFLQSADESASASVDGYRVGKAWTELHAPCKIEIGAARLRYRSLLPDDEQLQTETAPRPMTFPNADRPFKPGEFANTGPPGAQSTRVKPTAGAYPAAPGPASTAAPRPAVGRNVEKNNPTRPEGSGDSGRNNLNRAGAMPVIAHDSRMGLDPVQAIGQSVGQPPGRSIPYHVAKRKGLSAPTRILVILTPFCLIASGYLIFFDKSAPPASPLAVLDAGVDTRLAANTAPPSTRPPPPIPPSPPSVQSPCPQGFVPYTVPIGPGAAIPCVPIGTPMPPLAMTASHAPPPPAAVDAGAPAPVAFGTTTNTLERQAVDFVAVKDYARAAAVYEQLQAQNPSNRVYAEAARILRTKAGAGAP